MIVTEILASAVCCWWHGRVFRIDVASSVKGCKSRRYGIHISNSLLLDIRIVNGVCIFR